MQFVRLLPVILSGVLVGAHFLRNQQWLAVAITAAVLGVLPLRRKWVAYLAQGGLVLAGLEWTGTAMQLVQYRQSMGLAWTRLALILGGVALVTLLSALVFRLRPLRRRYGFIVGPEDG